MKLSPKFILAFLLLMLSFSVSGNAMNFSTCIFSDSPCQLSELSSDSNQRSSVDGQSVSYDSVRSLSVSDVELGLKLVTESNSNNYRLRRIIEINDSLKDVMQKFHRTYYPDIVVNRTCFEHRALFCSSFCFR